MSHKKKNRSVQFPASRHIKQTAGDRNSVRGWFFQHYPVFLFLLVFGVLMGLFYLCTAIIPYYNQELLPSYHHLIARTSAGVLRLLGQETTAEGTSIYSPRFSVKIIMGCDAVEATALFVCAVLAFPAPFLKKVQGIIAGTLLLGILNLVRIVSLFLIGIYLPNIFDFMHIDTWQAIFIFLAVTFWVFWLLWTTERQISKRAVTGGFKPNGS